MATLKTKLRPSSKGLGRLVYQVIHRREVKRITSRILINESDWDRQNSCPANDCPQMQSDLAQLRGIISRREAQGSEYTASDVADDYAKIKIKCPFFKFVDSEIASKLEKGRRGTASNYRNALRQYMRFRNGIDINVDSIDSAEMQAFEAWLVGNGVVNNTISSYMRPLRCIYRRAVAHGLCIDRSPFAKVYTGIAKTRKRAITESDIKAIARLDLSDEPNLEQARDLFMLSFYLMGMAFVDIAMLNKGDYAHGRIVYRRQKTGKALSVCVCDKAKALIAKLSAKADSPFLLNIIKDKDGDTRQQYLSSIGVVNRRLKKVAQMARLAVGITTYTPRHTWASIAKAKNIEISVISDALGHESENTTRIYLATIDTRRIDTAHRLIIKDI